MGVGSKFAMMKVIEGLIQESIRLFLTEHQVEMVVFLNRGPQCRAQNAIVLTIGTPKRALLILGTP